MPVIKAAPAGKPLISSLYVFSEGAKHKAKEEDKQAKKEAKVAATAAPAKEAPATKDKKKKSNYN